MTDQQYFLYTTEIGDRWDLIAFKFYGDATKTSPLIIANRHLFLDDFSAIPLIFKRPTEIRVPAIEAETIDEANLPPWKRSTSS